MPNRYLVGHAGTGKTSQLTRRLVDLIEDGARPDRILALVAQRSQAQRFRAALASVKGNTRGEPTLTTLFGLAQQHVTLFFPIVAESAGFAQPQREPVFINVESAQYFLNQIVEPRVAEFDDLKLYRPRLLSQILDSMNKAATSGFGLDELADRLAAAWQGEPRRIASYRAMQATALDFRAFCLQHSLLDFSLTMDVYARFLLASKSYQDYATARYRHVLADNIEEGAPALHDFLSLVLKTCDSAMLVEDDPGGYRLFLGADVASARGLRGLCELEEITERKEEREVDGAELDVRRVKPTIFAKALSNHLRQSSSHPITLPPTHPVTQSSTDPTPNAQYPVTILESSKYWTGMVQRVADEIKTLVSEGVPANNIAVLAPYVEDVLRFELSERLKEAGIGVLALRPSRPLYDHPVARALVTLAKLAHPSWNALVSSTELSRALSVTIEGLDVVRAQLIADASTQITSRGLSQLDNQALWNRVGMRFREQYEMLRKWLIRNQNTKDRRQTNDEQQTSSVVARQSPLDLFWQQLFTDILSQPSFGLNADRDGATVCDKVIRSARSFREVFDQADISPKTIPTHELQILGLSQKPDETAEIDIGLAYVTMLSEGILAAQYTPSASNESNDGILLAPIYAYLTNDLRSRVQFWLDVQSTGWHERIYQPLTHPYVLARSWDGNAWTDEDEHRMSKEMLRRVVSGLAFRCDERIYLASSQLNIAGQEESGMLARVLQGVL